MNWPRSGEAQTHTAGT